MIMFGSFLPSPLVGFCTTKVYSGIGADIVIESITLKCPAHGHDECNRDVTSTTHLTQCAPYHAMAIVKEQTCSGANRHDPVDSLLLASL